MPPVMEKQKRSLQSKRRMKMWRGPREKKKVEYEQNFSHLPFALTVHLQAITTFRGSQNSTMPLIPGEKEGQRECS